LYGDGTNYGVRAYNSSGGTTSAVYGFSRGNNGNGVTGEANTGAGAYGVWGKSTGGAGVFGSGGTYGVYGNANTYSIYGVGGTYAGYFVGNVQVVGNLSKSAGSFKIDHPLDPENKYLYHSFVESPDMKNIYDGVVNLNDNGEAWVELPGYFEALNKDFRYQLTCIGAYAPVYVAQEVRSNRFKIAGGKAGLKVSWQVTGIRHDPYADAHRIPVEEQKPTDERGKYLTPTEYGRPASKGIGYDRNREMQQLKQPQQPGQEDMPSPTKKEK
jgi:hypothetical protein